MKRVLILCIALLLLCSCKQETEELTATDFFNKRMEIQKEKERIEELCEDIQNSFGKYPADAEYAADYLFNIHVDWERRKLKIELYNTTPKKERLFRKYISNADFIEFEDNHIVVFT